MPPRKVVFDTNVLIGYLQHGRDAERVERVFEARFLSAVVVKELRQGLADRARSRPYRALVRAFERTRRILVPDWPTYERTGAILRAMRTAGVEAASASAFADVLIALSAKAIGATVVTRDRDFERIRQFDSFSLELIP
jgi:predicted nucleic acid-binding protein